MAERTRKVQDVDKLVARIDRKRCVVRSAMSGPAFDLVVRHARVATASDVFDADIGIVDGRITMLGSGLAAGRQEIDAAGRVVTPGGVDPHCHLDQPMDPPVRMADGFESGTRSAACGGTTTVIPFAAQRKGHTLRAAVDDYHRRAEGQAHVDYAFHLIVSDPTPAVLNEELPALIAEGYTSFKIYMTYDDLKLDDGQILDVLSVAREHGAMAMVGALAMAEQSISVDGWRWAPYEAGIPLLAVGVAVIAALVPSVSAYRVDVTHLLNAR